MKEVMVSLVVSDRRAMDGATGLHAQISIKRRLSDREHQLEGIALLSNQVEIERIDITVNPLGLSDETATAVLSAAFSTGWNALMIRGDAAAGIKWRPLLPWLAEHVDVDLLPTLVRQIEDALAKARER